MAPMMVKVTIVQQKTPMIWAIVRPTNMPRWLLKDCEKQINTSTCVTTIKIAVHTTVTANSLKAFAETCVAQMPTATTNLEKSVNKVFVFAPWKQSSSINIRMSAAFLTP